MKRLEVLGGRVKSAGQNKGALKRETHAARWGLLRGYSCKATKWVDFVMTDSTRRESCHSLKVTAKRIAVKGAFVDRSRSAKPEPAPEDPAFQAVPVSRESHQAGLLLPNYLHHHLNI